MQRERAVVRGDAVREFIEVDRAMLVGERGEKREVMAGGEMLVLEHLRHGNDDDVAGADRLAARRPLRRCPAKIVCISRGSDRGASPRDSGSESVSIAGQIGKHFRARLCWRQSRICSATVRGRGWR